MEPNLACSLVYHLLSKARLNFADIHSFTMMPMTRTVTELLTEPLVIELVTDLGTDFDGNLQQVIKRVALEYEKVLSDMQTQLSNMFRHSEAQYEQQLRNQQAQYQEIIATLEGLHTGTTTSCEAFLRLQTENEERFQNFRTRHEETTRQGELQWGQWFEHIEGFYLGRIRLHEAQCQERIQYLEGQLRLATSDDDVHRSSTASEAQSPNNEDLPSANTATEHKDGASGRQGLRNKPRVNYSS
ncbi:uncharacterized protein BDV14DRAFT_182327 [Aspergillus stella-maris]|uniref:uncharacterized protein n=1 Tax=Aspergillus stella-maris TaxID=1810926 RepID=UPI003CCCF475